MFAERAFCGWVGRSGGALGEYALPFGGGWDVRVALSFGWGLGFAFEDEGGAGGDVEL